MLSVYAAFARSEISNRQLEVRNSVVAAVVRHAFAARIAIRAALFRPDPGIFAAALIVTAVVARLAAGGRVRTPFAVILFTAGVAAVGTFCDGTVTSVQATLESVQEEAAGIGHERDGRQQTTQQPLAHR
jgi:hypothetical protein